VLQALHEGKAMRQQLHFCEQQMQTAAGVRMLIAVSRVAAVGLATLCVTSIEAVAQTPTYQLDATANRVVRLSNLSSSGDCHPASVSGRVVKREFDERGLFMRGLVLQDASGDRAFINVDRAAIDAPQVSMAARGWIVAGLRTMLAEGQQVHLGVKLCGAAGRVVMLDEVATVSASAPATPATPTAAYGPSFDCTSKAASTQALAQAICRNKELAYWELAYVISYQALRESSLPEVRKAMVDEANALVLRMNDQCGLPSTGGLTGPPSVDQLACVRNLFQESRLALVSRTTGAARDEATLTPQETAAIQRGLQVSEHLPATSTVDGVFGPVTRAAIASWQRENGMPATGFGSQALLRQISSPSSPPRAVSAAPPYTRAPVAAVNPEPTIDRTGRTSAIKLALAEGPDLRPQEVFEKVSRAVYVVKTQTALGSAVAISDRELLTNCHILESATTATLEREGERLPALVISANKDADRCILRLSNIVGPLPHWVRVRPYADVRVGERVFTVGAPRGLELSLADGMISSKRSLDEGRLFQTSAPISRGSSGGGLFDSHGNLIGITTFMLKDSQNLNFAIAAEEYAK
jgi:S1-C subfamily serine protease